MLIGRVTPKIRKTRFNYAMACIAKMKNVEFFQFKPEDIDYTKNVIKGTYHNGTKWVGKSFPYPDYVYDRMLTRGKKHSDFYEEFSNIPFSNEKIKPGSLNKVEMYEKIKAGGLFTEYLIPYIRVKSMEDVLHALDKYTEVICKPENGNGGLNVYHMKKTKDSFRVKINEEMIDFDEKLFIEYINKNVFGLKQSFILQPFIISKTNTGNPFDLRAHIMKNGRGEWEIVKIYPRIGRANTVISNIHLGGSICSLWTFLTKHINIDNPKLFERNIRDFALRFSNYIGKQFNYNFTEMGLDIGVDKENNLWLFEVNINRVSVEYLPFEAAEYAIEYGKYAALKQMKPV